MTFSAPILSRPVQPKHYGVRSIMRVPCGHVRVPVAVAFLAGVISCMSDQGPSQPPPPRLAFVAPPSASVDGQAIVPAVQVAVLDVSGNVVTTATDQITLALAGNRDAATLSGTLTVAPIQGVATFSDLRINPPGTYALTARAPGLTGTTSASFAITLAFAAVSPGEQHTCGRTTDGTAYCWGDNTDGQLGDGTATSIARLAPAPVAGGLVFTTLSAGFRRTCGIATGSAGYCWGHNGDGYLGDGTMTNQVSPAPVTGGLAFAAVNATTSHTCGVTTAGAAYCWGDNAYGQLGDGTTTPQTRPTAVWGGLTFATVATGSAHTCGVTTAGAVYCWGYNGSGELGDGTKIDRVIPTPVASGLTFRSLSAGSFHTCAVTTEGAAYCWGQNVSGELGDGTAIGRPSPVAVRGGLTFAAVSTGSAHNCGITTDGLVYCWGRNSEGELGDGTTTSRSTPTVANSLVTAGLNVAMLGAGAFHTCVVTTASAAYCWGKNSNGQLGDGTTTDRLAPVRIGPPTPVGP